MNNKNIKALAKERLSPNWGAAVGIIVILAVVRSLGAGIQAALMPQISPEAFMMAMAGEDPYLAMDQVRQLSGGSGLASTIGMIFSLVLTLMSTGVSWGYVKMVDTGDLEFESVTWAFPRFGEVILLILWIFLWTLLWTLPNILAMGILTGGLIIESDPLIIGGLIAFLVTSIFYISRIIRYSQAFLILYDNPKMGARAALRESIEQMRGKVGRYILLMLSYYLPIIIVSILMTVFIGIGINGFVMTMDSQGMLGSGSMLLGFGGAVVSIIGLIVLSFMLMPRIASGQAVFYTELIRRERYFTQSDFDLDQDSTYEY